MATFQEVTWTTGVTSAGGVANVAMPSSVAVGDILVMTIWEGSITAPAGWHKVTESSLTQPRLREYTKVADGTEGGTTVATASRLATAHRFVAGTAHYLKPYTAFTSGPSATNSGQQHSATYTDLAAVGNLGTNYALSGLWVMVGNEATSYTSDAYGNNRGSVAGYNDLNSGTSFPVLLLLLDFDNVTGDQSAIDQIVLTWVPIAAFNAFVGFSYSAPGPLARPITEQGGGNLSPESRRLVTPALPYQLHSNMLGSPVQEKGRTRG